MKRREFMRSLGGAVAAVMLPFVAPLPKIREPSFYDELVEMFEKVKAARRTESDRIDIFTDAATAAKFKTMYALYLQGTFN